MSGPLSASGVRAWLEWPDVHAFIAELEEFNRKLSGKAQLFAMSPTDLELRVTNLDSKGHCALHFVVGCTTNGMNGWFENTLTGAIEIEPSQVEAMLKWFRSIVAQAADA